jgi:hypothetical protein
MRVVACPGASSTAEPERWRLRESFAALRAHQVACVDAIASRPPRTQPACLAAVCRAHCASASARPGLALLSAQARQPARGRTRPEPNATAAPPPALPGADLSVVVSLTSRSQAPWWHGHCFPPSRQLGGKTLQLEPGIRKSSVTGCRPEVGHGVARLDLTPVSQAGALRATASCSGGEGTRRRHTARHCVCVRPPGTRHHGRALSAS